MEKNGANLRKVNARILARIASRVNINNILERTRIIIFIGLNGNSIRSVRSKMSVSEEMQELLLKIQKEDAGEA